MPAPTSQLMQSEVELETSYGRAVDQTMNVVNHLAEGFGAIYARLNYPGYVSVLGAILIFWPLATRRIPGIEMEQKEQLLYVISGAFFILLGAAWLSVQNLLIFKVQKLHQETACRMLELRIKGVQAVHESTVEVIKATKAEAILPISFAQK